MLLVTLFALGATVCAATSSVLKHRSAGAEPAAWAHRLPRSVASIVANPVFALAMIADAGAVVLQLVALRYGDLTVVQPILTAALVFSLLLDHALSRTRVTARELILSAVLVVGLVTFLIISGAVAPQGEVAVGQRTPGAILAALGILLLVGALVTASRARPTVGARAIAIAVGAIYATTAALMKSTTRIYALRGPDSLVRSWQLWVLLLVAAVGLVLNQRAFAMAPLAVSLPITASLDPLFSVVVGMAVYDEQLRATPGAIAGEVLGIGLLLFAVARLSRSEAGRETATATDPADAHRS